MVNITGALANRFMFKACNKSCSNDDTTATKRVAIVWLGLPAPYLPSESPAPNVRYFRSQACFANHKQRTTKYPFFNARDAVRPVESFRETISTNVAKVL